MQGLREVLTSGKYTIVGVVIDGMDVLDKMEKIKVGKCQSCPNGTAVILNKLCFAIAWAR